MTTHFSEAAEQRSRKRIAILGAGLSGLTAAYRLLELDPDQTRYSITVYEKSHRYGGVFGTIEHDGYRIESGADSFITNKPHALELCHRLGLTDRLISTQSEYRQSLILHRGKPVATPKGFNLMVPQQLWPMLMSPLLSIPGKLRVLGELLVRANPQEDESLASFVTRRFGNEFFENIVQPMIGGIYTADPEKLSLRATLPRFLEMEAEHGSLIKAVLSQKGELLRNSQEKASGVRYGLFASLKDGMSELLDALWNQLHPRVECRLSTVVTSIAHDPHTHEYSIQTEDASGQTEVAMHDALLMALPGCVAAELASTFAPKWSEAIGQIDYASSAIAVSGHKLAEIRNPMKAFGLVIPEKERRRILAVSFTSRKFAGRAPEGCIELRTFVGGAMQPEYLSLADDQLTELVLQELHDIFGVTGTPDFVHIARWNKAMPQYHVGHLGQVQRIQSLQQQLKSFEYAGNALEGVGLPDVIATAEAAAQRLSNSINTEKNR